jgi:hypothetical protein
MTETLLKVAKNMILLNPRAYSTGVVKDWNIIERGITHQPPEPPAYIKAVVNNWNIIESGIKHEPPQSPSLQQRSGKWLKHYWKWQKTWSSKPPVYSTGVVNDWNNIESGIKHEPPEPHAYSKGMVNNKQYWKWHKTWASWAPLPIPQVW